ncbi:hypothetical protein ScPMuIL_008865 [Solemya velum]
MDQFQDVFNSTNLVTELSSSLSESGLARTLVPVVVYAVLMMTVGTIGNIVVCYVYSNNSKNTTSKYFIRCLAILDLTSCVICIPLEISMLRLPISFDIPELCKLLRFVRSTTSIGSGIILLAIAIDRYIKICRPIQTPIAFKSAKRACTAACVIAVIFSSPSLVLFGSKGLEYYKIAETSCSTEESLQGTVYPTLYYSFLFFLFFGTSTCLAVLYSFVAMKVIKHRTLRTFSSATIFSTAHGIDRNNSTSTTGSVGAEKRKLKPEDLYAGSLPKKSSLLFQKRTIPVISVSSSMRRSRPNFRHRTTIMLILITAIYFLSMVPYFAVMVYRSVIPNFEVMSLFLYSGANEFFRLSNKSSIVNTRSDESNFIHVFSETHWRNITDRRTILLWTTFRGQSNWQHFHLRGVGQCKDKCFVTSDRKHLERADAILFHLGDLWPWTKMPSYRHPSQRWVLFNSEPPPYLSGSRLNVWNNVFNWTLWYRSDATVLAPYGGFQQMSDEDIHVFNKRLRFQNYAKEKSKLVSMAVDDCYDDARRYKTLENLEQYVTVDTYGQCGETPCSKGQECNRILGQYSFHLALEKAHCRDFITDQYWNALRRNQIPIVHWLPPVKNILLPNSYINILDFSNMKELSDYLHKVAMDPKLFNSYFGWKQRFSINCGARFSCHWCTLCEALQDRMKHAQIYTDLEGWVKNDYCHMWTIPRSIWRYVDSFLHDIGLS